MKFIPETVSRKAGQLLLKGAKHSPRVLFVVGIAGFVGTVVLSSRASLKLEGVLVEHAQKIEDVKEIHASGKHDDRDEQKDVALVYFQTITKITKLYLPALATAAVSIGCLTGAHNILTKRNVALTAAYAAVETSFKEYRQRVQNELGDEKDREFLYGGEKREIVEVDEKGKVISSTEVIAGQKLSGYARFFDECSANWSKDPMRNQYFLNMQQNAANDRLRARGHLFLNEVYDMLGLERSPAGQVVGWLWDHDGEGDGYVDFGFMKDDSQHRAFVSGIERNVLLDFNVDGDIMNKI